MVSLGATLDLCNCLFHIFHDDFCDFDNHKTTQPNRKVMLAFMNAPSDLRVLKREGFILLQVLDL